MDEREAILLQVEGAARDGDLPLLRELCDEAVLLSNREAVFRMVLQAATNDRGEILDWLSKHGVIPSELEMAGFYPLHRAVYDGDIKALGCLLERGYSVNQKDREGDSALHVAIDTEVQDAIGESDLRGHHVPASVDLTSILLSHGADINAMNVKGETPLDKAILLQYKPAESLLRERGAIRAKS